MVWYKKKIKLSLIFRMRKSKMEGVRKEKECNGMMDCTSALQASAGAERAERSQRKRYHKIQTGKAELDKVE